MTDCSSAYAHCQRNLLFFLQLSNTFQLTYVGFKQVIISLLWWCKNEALTELHTGEHKTPSYLLVVRRCEQHVYCLYCYPAHQSEQLISMCHQLLTFTPLHHLRQSPSNANPNGGMSIGATSVIHVRCRTACVIQVCILHM